MDTMHVSCLSSAFWRFFILGRMDANLLIVTPWYLLFGMVTLQYLTSSRLGHQDNVGEWPVAEYTM
jgi:hypothetical protein